MSSRTNRGAIKSLTDTVFLRRVVASQEFGGAAAIGAEEIPHLHLIGQFSLRSLQYLRLPRSAIERGL